MLLRCYENDYGDDKHYVQSTSHHTMSKHHQEVTISLAARATSAAPTFFPEVNFPIDKPLKQLSKDEQKTNLVFWDGGLLNNNPIDQLWYARYELVQPHEPPPAISCVISLGTGFVESESLSGGMLHLKGVISSVMAFSTNTNAKGKDMTRHFSRLNARSEHSKSRYIRFQPLLKEDIGLDEYLRMRELETFTEGWMKSTKYDRQKWVRQGSMRYLLQRLQQVRVNHFL